jgi:hypothetical protein
MRGKINSSAGGVVDQARGIVKTPVCNIELKDNKQDI